MRVITLPEAIRKAILLHGVTVRGYDPAWLLSRATFFEMRKQWDYWLTFLGAPRWGITFDAKSIMIDPDYVPKLSEYPNQYADEVWHELVHIAQRNRLGDAKFNLDYLWEVVKHFGAWKKGYLEKEAFGEQAAFRQRMYG